MSIVLNLQVENYYKNDSFRPDYSPIISQRPSPVLFTELLRMLNFRANSIY